MPATPAVKRAAIIVAQACIHKQAGKYLRAKELRAELVKQADAHPELWKCAFGEAPFSSLTARSAVAAGLTPAEPETDRRGMLQRHLEKMLAGMSRSRASIVDARRSARESVQRRVP